MHSLSVPAAAFENQVLVDEFFRPTQPLVISNLPKQPERRLLNAGLNGLVESTDTNCKLSRDRFRIRIRTVARIA